MTAVKTHQAEMRTQNGIQDMGIAILVVIIFTLIMALLYWGVG